MSAGIVAMPRRFVVAVPRSSDPMWKSTGSLATGTTPTVVSEAERLAVPPYVPVAGATVSVVAAEGSETLTSTVAELLSRLRSPGTLTVDTLATRPSTALVTVPLTVIAGSDSPPGDRIGPGVGPGDEVGARRARAREGPAR